MLGPFRECFLDEVYLKHIDPACLKKESPVVIDIGANAGYFSLYMFYKYPKAIVYAFEPLPYCVTILKNYQSQYKSFNWHIYPKAVSNITKPIEIYTDAVDGFSTTASMYTPGKGHKLQVEAETLQHFIQANAIKQVDLLKLDCEGAEYAILYNLPDEVWPKITCITMEAHLLRGNQENVHDMAGFLKSKGYSLIHTDTGGVGNIWAYRKDPLA